MKRSLFKPIIAAAMAAVVFAGCQSRDIEPSPEPPESSETIADKPFTAMYSAEGSAEDITAAADIIRERLASVYGGEVGVSAAGNTITVELPDCTSDEAEELLEDIDKTALLTFRMGWSGDIPEGGSYEELELVLTGEELETAAAYYNEIDYRYCINLALDEKGTELFKAATEIACEDQGRISIWLDDEELIAPQVANVIPDGACSIMGNFSADEAIKLAALMNSGALPVELTRTHAE